MAKHISSYKDLFKAETAVAQVEIETQRYARNWTIESCMHMDRDIVNMENAKVVHGRFYWMSINLRNG